MKLVSSFLISLSLCAAIVTGVNYASAEEPAEYVIDATERTLTDADRAHVLAESLGRATEALEALGDDPANRSHITPDTAQFRADLAFARPILLAQADTGSAAGAGTPDAVPPIAAPLDELAALKAKYDALMAAKDSGSKDLIWFAYAALGAAVLRVLLAALTAWRGDKPRGWAKWTALGAAVPLYLLTYYGMGTGLWAAIVMAGAGPGAIVVNELIKSFGKKA